MSKPPPQRAGAQVDHPTFIPILSAFIIMTAFCAAVTLIPAVFEALLPSLPGGCVTTVVRIAFVLGLVLVRRRRFAKVNGIRQTGVHPQCIRHANRRQHSIALVMCALCGVLLQLSFASAISLICGSDSIGVTAIPSDIASLAALLSAVIITPVCEETVFRGAAYRAARISVGALPTALLTSLAFALIHHGAAAMISAFVCGLILAALTERHSSILGAVILHSAFNLTSFFAGYLPLSPAVCTAIFIPLTAVCVIFTVRKGTKQ